MGQEPVKINEMCQNSAAGDDKPGGAIPDGRQGTFCQWGALPPSSVGKLLLWLPQAWTLHFSLQAGTEIQDYVKKHI